jgi:hypothetical protein
MSTWHVVAATLWLSWMVAWAIVWKAGACRPWAWRMLLLGAAPLLGVVWGVTLARKMVGHPPTSFPQDKERGEERARDHPATSSHPPVKLPTMLADPDAYMEPADDDTPTPRDALPAAPPEGSTTDLAAWLDDRARRMRK